MRGRSILLAAAAALLLTACGDHWTAVEEDRAFSAEDYSASEDARQIPADWVLPETLPYGEQALSREELLGDGVRREVRGDYLLYGRCTGSAMPEGFSVVRRGSDDSLKEVYSFREGITVAWQPFFRADGKYLAFPWSQSLTAGAWHLRLVALDSGKEEELELPEWDGDTDYVFTLWQEDGSLLVTQTSSSYNDTDRKPATWVYQP